MALEYIQGNILTAFREGEFNVLLHQTNCVTGERVSGIAKSVFEEYPGALQAHLNYCVFGDYSLANLGEEKYIINCNSQYYSGSSSNMQFNIDSCDYYINDTFQNRLIALGKVLVRNCYEELTVGIPLIASGVGADKLLKGSMRDLEYFQKFIAPTVEKYLPNCKVYYL